MKLEEFLLLSAKHSVPQIVNDLILQRNNGQYLHVSSAFMRILNNSTKDVDFGCDFDETGLCANYRTRSTYRDVVITKKCCCGGCRNNIGYLRHVTYSTLNRYADLFDEQNGYWQPTGCVLPRELRSTVCLRHRCTKYNRAGKIIPFSIHDEFILHFVSCPADAYFDYNDWNIDLGVSAESFSNFIDAWIKRLAGKMVWNIPLGTWRKYYEENPYIS